MAGSKGVNGDACPEPVEGNEIHIIPSPLETPSRRELRPARGEGTIRASFCQKFD